MKPNIKRKKPVKSASTRGTPGGRTRCIETIAALTEGSFNRWLGLPDDCTRIDVEHVLLPMTSPDNESSQYTGPLDYAPTALAPNGLTVYYDVGMVDYIIIGRPRFPRPFLEMLGEPAAKLPSYLENSREQWIYPGQGLALHMMVFEPGVNWLYVFHPTTLQAYEDGPLSRVRTLRHRIPRESS
jgi:hypothetical protein